MGGAERATAQTHSQLIVVCLIVVSTALLTLRADRCLAQQPATAPTTRAATQSSGPLPVPSQAEQAAALKRIREVYPSNLSRQTASERTLLASKLLNAALETRDDPAGRYVMLQEAMKIAAAAGDTGIVGKAADALQAGYAGDAEAQRADALARCYAVAPSPAVAGQVAAADVAAAEEAAANDEYESASRYIEKALSAARIVGDRTFLASVQARATAIRDQREEFNQVRSAFSKLKSDPQDPAANLAVGQYLCFKKDKWESGLADLAKGSDPALKQLAQNEMGASGDPNVRGDLAEQWWNLADQNSRLPRKAIQAHAAELYRQAMRGLGGLAKAVAKKRIDEVASQQPPATASLNPPAITPPPPPVRDLLGTLIGGTPLPDGTIEITSRSRARTPQTFKPPVAFRLVARTDSTNIRIKYAATQIIFDWEVNPDQLRVDGGPANGRHKNGAGYIKPGDWATIDLLVLPDSLSITVNGQERYRTSADFSEIDQPFGLFTIGNAVLQIKSLLVRTP
jgi:hypothetical protein